MNGVTSTKAFKPHEPLKPCPFCGHDAEPKALENYAGEKEYQIECTNCAGSMSWFQKKPLVVNWNMRVKK
jgi:hypothetical protein